MRQSLTETLDTFKAKFVNGFHDSHFLSIEYNFDAGNPRIYWSHRVTVKISTPDWKNNYASRPPRRIVLIFEMEGVIDYLFLKKQENTGFNKIADIDVIIDNGFILLDFFPYHDTHPLRGSTDIYKHYENERTGSLFVLKGKVCYWSVIE